jgi:5-formyltetrahydrofolate cyclo-ligase
MSDKARLRALARAKRALLQNDSFAQKLAAHAPWLGAEPGMVIAGYHAHQDEADPALLLKALAAAGAYIAFPRVTQDDRLEFHLVPKGEILAQGRYGIHEPLANWPLVRPALLLVPLLAYDNQGYRLGYGGGYYDRVLATLPGARAIGIAYSGQAMDKLPHDCHDHPLQAVLTEEGLREFPR